MTCGEVIQLVGVIVTGAGIIASIIVTNKNTNKQIENQNKETYKPRLKLKGFINQNRNNDQPEYLANSYFYNKDEFSYNIYTKMILENIGNGIAHDISFYTLNNGESCMAVQSIESDEDQEGFSTKEIPKNKEYEFPFSIYFNEKNVNARRHSEKDFCLIICNYKDLNLNNYKILICYSIKGKNHEEKDGNGNEIENGCFKGSYYYQEETLNYKVMINTYKEQYKKILKLIDKENNWY